jgi:hypothetical protein
MAIPKIRPRGESAKRLYSRGIIDEYAIINTKIHPYIILRGESIVGKKWIISEGTILL